MYPSCFEAPRVHTRLCDLCVSVVDWSLTRYPDLFQRLERQVRRAGRLPVRLQDVTHDIGVRRGAERIRRLLRHRPLDGLEQVVDGLAAPARGEGGADQGRGVTVAHQIVAVATA